MKRETIEEFLARGGSICHVVSYEAMEAHVNSRRNLLHFLNRLSITKDKSIFRFNTSFMAYIKKFPEIDNEQT
jgi:hypothetical protein